MKKHHRKITFGQFFGDSVLRLLLIFAVIVSVFPFVYMFFLSLMNTTSMKLTIEKIMTERLSFDNYYSLFVGSSSFGRYLLNSAIVSVYSCVVTCLVSAMAAYAFAKIKFAGRDKIYAVYLMTMMIPTQALLIPSFLIVKMLGLLNTYTAMALPTINAFGVIMMRSFMKNLPDELIEAADLDGCSESRKFVQIVLPLVKPALISLTIFTFIGVWGSLLWPLVVSSGDMTTVTMAIANLKNGLDSTDYGVVMAATTSAFMPPFILYLFLQKQFVEGIALSGIKG